jgi:hypothetical protein
MMEDPEGSFPLEPAAPAPGPWEAPPGPSLPSIGFFPPPKAARDPFWGYGDLLIFAGFTIPCFLLAMGIVKAVFWLLALHPAVPTWRALSVQCVFYGLLFGVLAVLFRVEYDRPLLRSLGWMAPHRHLFSMLVGGVGLAIGVMLLGLAIRVPRVENPLSQLLKDPMSLCLVAVFGSIVAPFCEELLFRGFLQPLLVRGLGAFAGILTTATAFGLMHYQEYGNSWRHVLLIGISGVAFGWVRHLSGSTRTSAAMHAWYNGFQFVILLLVRSRIR